MAGGNVDTSVWNRLRLGLLAPAASLIVGSITLPKTAEAEDANFQAFDVSGTVALGQGSAKRRPLHSGSLFWGETRIFFNGSGATSTQYTGTLDRIDDATNQLRSYTTGYLAYSYHNRS